MSDDLARLRLNGLIQRHPGSNTYQLTADGLRVAIFYTKVHDRLLTPLIAANAPPAPLALRRALSTITATCTGTSPKHGSETQPENPGQTHEF